jgi:hypothetical protein
MIESLALKLDSAPLNAIWRLLFGFALYPAYNLLCDEKCPPWFFLAYILFILVALRALPIVFRKLIKFSAEAQMTWADRRQLAKVYDSFQWRKLFWMGLGLGGYLLCANVHHDFATCTALLFTIGGGFGLLTWVSISRKMKLESPAKMA